MVRIPIGMIPLRLADDFVHSDTAGAHHYDSPDAAWAPNSQAIFYFSRPCVCLVVNIGIRLPQALSHIPSYGIFQDLAPILRFRTNL
jgi:hypothetical protein